MTIITLHHLCFGHCVNSSVIVLDFGIFLRELRSLRKIPRSKTITSDFTQWPQKRRCAVIIVETITSYDTIYSRQSRNISLHQDVFQDHYFLVSPCFCYQGVKNGFLLHSGTRPLFCRGVIFQDFSCFQDFLWPKFPQFYWFSAQFCVF